ncbi:MAG: thioredoxin family protein [Gammaproteobacteria bacterium]|nr:thioredoxin family protein [Gammaproteobacteria bacterium]
MREKSARPVPNALLLTTSICPYCPTVQAGLAELVKQGKIDRLEIVDIGTHPEVAQQYGVRGVPWLRLGPFELQGLRSPTELAQWAERAGTIAGMAEYFRESLDTGELAKVIALVKRDSSAFDALWLLLADPDTALGVRVGIGAVLEEFAGSAPLQKQLDALGKLTQNRLAHVRGDAAHYLALTRDTRALPYLQALLNDPEAQVREIAREGVMLLGAG